MILDVFDTLQNIYANLQYVCVSDVELSSAIPGKNSQLLVG